MRPDVCRPSLERRERDLAQVALGGEPVAEEPVARLAGHLGHALAHPGQEDLGVAVRVGARVEERRHQGVGVEVAAEVERGAVVPAVPDGADGEDHLAHARRRRRPLHGEALGDVRLDLGAEAEDEPTPRVGLQVVGDLGQVHRVAGEGHGDAGAELDVGGVLGREQEREEGVVRRLDAPQPVVARLLALRRAGGDVGEPESDSPVDLHGPDTSGAGGCPGHCIGHAIGWPAARRRAGASSGRRQPPGASA